jgi:hypothetical protein
MNGTEPKGDGPGLTARQRRALPFILEAPTMEAGARAAGVSKTTLYEWLKRDPFRAQLEAARADLFKEGMGALKGAAGKAARRLIELLDSKNENTRRLTAREVLALSMRIDETEGLEKRIEALEESLLSRAGGLN